MSVLIKGMKMPTGCLSCDFCNPFVDEPYCRRLMRKVSKSTRLVDCPLVSIPTPHGRLIDADKIPFVQSENGCADDYAYRYDINELPTIIEAEE